MRPATGETSGLSEENRAHAKFWGTRKGKAAEKPAQAGSAPVAGSAEDPAIKAFWDENKGEPKPVDVAE